MSLGVFAGLFMAGAVSAAEIITAEDFKQEIVVSEQLVRVADNALFLLDGSSSMNKKFGDTGKSAYRVVLDELKKRNASFPDLGHKFGIYIYTEWTPIYPMQTYDRDKVANALESMPGLGRGPTWLNDGLKKAEKILETLSGPTALFLFTDGSYSGTLFGKRPIHLADHLVSNYDVCIYVISTAEEKVNQRMIENVAGLNSCSRVIPFADFINRPEYNTGALFEVKATESLITVTDQRIVGLKADDLTFRFDEYKILEKDMAELEVVADFLVAYPKAWVVIKGYADNIGSEEVNNKLSRQRAEVVANHLAERGISVDRIIVLWYGSYNPVAGNDTDEGRAKNRRVEVAVGL
jgi:outer membrane protein OmpA-like peptidoglycan-associated protein